MTNLRHILALNIKKKRHSLGFSQGKLAEKVNTAPTYIAMIELEKRSPSFEMIERIAKALNIDPPDLFSKKVLPVEAANKFCISLLADLEKVINNRIKDYERKTTD
jgi:transcriptional regulator with XRE-family HTH domain